MKLFTRLVFFLLLIFLPSQFGIHVWFPFSLVLGRQIDYLSLSITIVDIFLLLGVASVLIRQKFSITPKRLVAVFLIVFTIAVHLFTSQNPLLAFLGILSLFKIFSLAFLVYRLKPTPLQLLLPISIGILYTFILAVSQFLLQSSLGSIWYFLGERTFGIDTPAIALLTVMGRQLLRSYATFPHPNVMGGFMLVLLPFFLFLRVKTKLHYLLRQLMIFMLLFIIFLSFSRIVWILAFYLVLYALVKQKFKFIFLLMLLIFLGLEELFLGRFVSLAADSLSITQRVELTKIAIELFKRYPLFGVGLLNFIPQLPTVNKSFYFLQPVHNAYLLLLSETGLLGLALFLGGIFFLLKKRMLISRSLAWAWCIFAIVSLFDHYVITLDQTRLLIGFLFGLTLLRIKCGKNYDI